MALKFNPITGNLDLVLDKASEIKYDNSGTNISGVNAQSAITELDSRLYTDEEIRVTESISSSLSLTVNRFKRRQWIEVSATGVITLPAIPFVTVGGDPVDGAEITVVLINTGGSIVIPAGSADGAVMNKDVYLTNQGDNAVFKWMATIKRWLVISVTN